VHIWLLDALALLVWHRSRYGRSNVWLRWALVVAATSFVIGTFMDVVLSWFYIVAVIQNRADSIVRVGINLAVTELVAAGFWMVAATIFATVTLILGGRAAAVDERRSLQPHQRAGASSSSSSRHQHHQPPSKATTVDDHLDEDDGTIYYV
jgi:hypothetical protein